MKTFAFLGNGYMIVTMAFLLFNLFSNEFNTFTRNLAIKLAPFAKLSPTIPKTVWQSYAIGSVIAVIPYLNAVVFVLLVVATICSLVFVYIMGKKVEKIEKVMTQYQNQLDEKYEDLNVN